jgi:hypothetical protein
LKCFFQHERKPSIKIAVINGRDQTGLCSTFSRNSHAEKERRDRERFKDLAVFERVDGNRERTSAELALKKVGEQLLRSIHLYHLCYFPTLCTIDSSSQGLLKTPGVE